MQPISSFNDNLGTAIMLVGGAGSGKTSLGMRLFPKTYVGVADLNFSSGKRYLESRGLLSNVVGYDNFLVDETTGKPIQANLRYNKMLECMTKAFADPNIDAVFLDSATFIEDIIKAKICGAVSDAAIKLTGFEQWGSLLIAWKGIIMQARQSGKKLILSAHENKEKDESDQIFKYQISVDGSIRGKFPALFSDVWRCEVAESNGQYTWNIRPLSNVRQEHLKNTFGLTGVIKQDDVVAKVREALK